MSTPIRGTEAVKAMRDMFDQFLTECARIDAWTVDSVTMPNTSTDLSIYQITADERLEVFQRRRDKIAAQLENKGLKVTPEAATDTLPSIAAAHAMQASVQAEYAGREPQYKGQ